MVSEEGVQAVVKAGTYSATRMGRQSPIIIAVTNKDLRDRLSAGKKCKDYGDCDRSLMEHL